MIQKQGKGIIREDALQKYIDYVYPNWTEDEKAEYDDTRRIFEKFISEEMAPLEYSEQKEEDYYKQFDGQKVLPMSLSEEFQQYLSDYEFIKADSLLVSVSTGRLMSLLHSEQVELKSFAYPVKDSVKMKKEFVIKTTYSQELGLQFDMNDNNEQLEEDNFL